MLGVKKRVKKNFYLSTHSNVNTMIPKEFSTGKDSLGVGEEYIEVEVIELSSFIKDEEIDLIRMDMKAMK